MIKAIGIVFFLIGAYGIYWSGKRSFERRNMAGVEEFSSYGKVVSARAVEGTVSIASKLAVAFGFLVFAAGWGLGK